MKKIIISIAKVFIYICLYVNKKHIRFGQYYEIMRGGILCIIQINQF